MSHPAIATRGLTKRYGKTLALDGLDVALRPGRVVGVLGPNGSGKTTLIRLLVGRLRPTDGKAHVGGHDPAALHRAGVSLGYMPQMGGLYADLTVAQNVRFFAAVQGVPRRDRAAAVEEAMRRVHLEARAHDRVSGLSGGMKRRVSLACAIVHRPRFLFLDEPTVGVDPELREALWADLHRLRDAGATILVSTHYLGEADRCDEVLLLRGGHLLAHDTPKRLMARTRTKNMDDAFLALLRRRA